jgi:hypothetical protein
MCAASVRWLCSVCEVCLVCGVWCVSVGVCGLCMCVRYVPAVGTRCVKPMDGVSQLSWMPRTDAPEA